MANRTPTAIVIVDQDGNHPGQTFEELEDGEKKTLKRGLKFDNSTGATSWVHKDDAEELPFREDPTGEYDPAEYGITWHFPK